MSSKPENEKSDPSSVFMSTPLVQWVSKSLYKKIEITSNRIGVLSQEIKKNSTNFQLILSMFKFSTQVVQCLYENS